MKKTLKSRQILSLLLMLAMLLSLSGITVFAAPEEPEVPIILLEESDELLEEPETSTEVPVALLDAPEASAEEPAFLDGDAILDLESGETAYPGGVVITDLPASWTTPSNAMTTTQGTNGLITMTVDGVEFKIEAKGYDGDVVFTVTPTLIASGSTITSTGRGNYNPQRYRTGMYFDQNGLDLTKSVASAADQSKVDTDAQVIDGLEINSGNYDERDGSPQFSGLVFNGSSAYEVKNSTINLYSDADGNPWSSSDFSGLGTAVLVANGAKVAFDNVDIHTTGVGKPALITSAASFLFRNSSYNVEGGTLYDTYRSGADFNRMMSPPWVLGIGGNARGANLMGSNCVQAFVDSSMTSDGWAVISTESGGGVISAINCDLTMTGPTGYGTYSIGSTAQNFFGCTFDTATYAVIFRGNAGVSFQPYYRNQAIDVGSGDRGFAGVTSATTAAKTDCSIDSQIGFMIHGGGRLTLDDTDITTRNAAFLQKAGSTTVTMDGGSIASDEGVILQIIDDDDPPIGTYSGSDAYGSFGNPCFNTYYTESAGWQVPSTSSSVSGGFTGTFTNIALKGNMYNASGYRTQTRNENTGNITNSNPAAQNMNITLGQGATLEGAISTSRPAHVWMVWEDAPGANAQNGYYRYATPADAASITALGEGRAFEELVAGGITYLHATSYREWDYYNQGHVVNDLGVFNTRATANVTLTGDAVWTVTGDCYLTSLTIGADAAVKAAAGTVLTMTVNGIETRIESGKSYAGAIVLAVRSPILYFNQSSALTTTPTTHGGPGTPTVEPVRVGAYVNGGLVDAYSVPSAIISGAVSATGISDVVINSQNDKFNGIIIHNTGTAAVPYEVNDVNITLNGLGGDDFRGWGAGILTTGNSVVEVNRAYIDSTGAIRTTIASNGGAGAKLTVNDSVLIARSSDESSQEFKDLTVPMMKRVPWALSLEGNVRAVNILGRTEATFNDSIVVSDGWGALSTDSGSAGTRALTTNNVFAGIGTLEAAQEGKDYDYVKNVNGVDYGFTMGGSGYGSYSDQGVINEYNDSVIMVPDVAMIHAAGASSSIFNNSDITTNRFGAIFHGGGLAGTSNGYMNVNGGSWDVGQSMFLLRASQGATGVAPNITVDGADITIQNDPEKNYDGILIQLIESDDAGSPVETQWTIPVAENNWSLIQPTTNTSATTRATFKNLSVEGDIFNARYSRRQILDVTFDNAAITGLITSSNANHVYADGTAIPGGTVMSSIAQEGANPEERGPMSYLYGGRLSHVAAATVNNPVELTLANGSVWTVAGTSFLSKLTIDGNSSLAAPEGYKVFMKVNGAYTDIKAGSYENVEVEIATLVSATPSARVDKLNGNQNRLYITVTEVYSNGVVIKIEWNGLINNNAAGTYAVGGYKVYVDTKGNDQIRECRIVN